MTDIAIHSMAAPLVTQVDLDDSADDIPSTWSNLMVSIADLGRPGTSARCHRAAARDRGHARKKVGRISDAVRA
jgi:hypothetical protein